MSPATITPTKHTNTTTNFSTVGSDKLRGDRLLFTTYQIVQDLQTKCNNILESFSSDHPRARALVVKDVKDVVATLAVIDSNLEKSMKLDRKLYQCKIFLSNMKSETNAQLKRQQLTGHGVGKRKTAEETRLAAVLATTPSQVPKKSKKKQSALQPVVPIDLKVAALLEWRPPINGTHYDLHELVTYILKESESPIYNTSAEKVHAALVDARKIACRKSILERHCTTFRKNNTLPRPGHDGATNGRLPLVPKEKNGGFNEFIETNAGVAGTSTDVKKQIQQFLAQDREDRQLPPLLAVPPIHRDTEEIWCRSGFTARSSAH
jgi:CRISPR/Cas system CMR-associated protein Cmr5 small subunit